MHGSKHDILLGSRIAACLGCHGLDAGIKLAAA
jgi:hypothetical protein